MKKIVALIPARSGSKRVVNKNIKLLGGHPLIAYTIAAALQSTVFSDVIVSTDSEPYADIANHYGARVPFLRPNEMAGEISPDIEWVTHSLKKLKEMGNAYECFSILRPTSPFRQPETIRRAWNLFIKENNIDSLRAVEKCSQHPAKMWFIKNNRLNPVLEGKNSEIPWHSSQYSALPVVYVQNASLEIAWTRVVFEEHSISGTAIIPFLTLGYEGFDVNTDYDWQLAEQLIRTNHALLPKVSQNSFKKL